MTTFSSDQLNFFKFSTVVIDEFPVALRKVFEFLWNNQTAPPPGFQLWDDSPLVRNLFLNKESRPGRRKLNVPTSKSFMEWDCTALFECRCGLKNMFFSTYFLFIFRYSWYFWL